MLMCRNFACLIALLSLIPGCGDEGKYSDSPRPATGAEAESASNADETAATGSPTIDSVVLRQALHELWVETQIENEGRTEADARAGLDEFVTKLIDALRQKEPGFLKVSAEVEARLQRGEAIEDAVERINSLSSSFQVESSFAKHLFQKRDAAGLTPVQTELLAHLLAADKAVRLNRPSSAE